MVIKHSVKLVTIVFMASFLASCFEAGERKDDPISIAVSSPERSDRDRSRDEGRKPDQILRFFGAKPGMTIIDIFSGGGYYTEMLNSIVGEGGKVIAHNNQGYKDFAKEEHEPRFRGGRLANTQQYWAEASELSFDEGSADLVMIVLGVHDVYYKPENESWPTIDENKFYNSIVNAIREGGVLGVIDHRAAAGAPSRTGHTIHRIDPEIIIKAFTERGLVLEAQSDILANKDDSLTKPMWDEAITGKTDRFVLRFRKPASQ